MCGCQRHYDPTAPCFCACDHPWRHPLIAKLGTPPAKPSVKIAGLTAYAAKPPKKWRLYWLFWIFGMVVTGFVLPELHALLNKQKGDTLSENIRYWLKPDTPGGGASWLAILGFLLTLLIWLAGHIFSVPGWPLTG